MDDLEAGKEKASNNSGTDFHKWGESGKAIECHEKDLESAVKIAFLFRRTQGIPPVCIVAFLRLLSQVNHEFKTMGTMI